MRIIKFRVYYQGRMWTWKNSQTVCNFIRKQHLYIGSKIMQFTGLKDKNGVEIYEGDIIEDQFGCITEVVWASRGFWDPCAEPSCGLNGENGLCNGDVDTYTVIGNKFENPKLVGAN